MKRLFLLLIGLFLFIGIYAQNQIKLISQNSNETIIQFNISDYQFHKVQTPNGTELTISADNSTPLLIKGAPDLPQMTASIIINDLGGTNIEVISQKHEDINYIDIAPSKGNLLRNIDPASVPYTYGEAYNKNQFFPGNLTESNQPYIARDFRGQAIHVYPFQYNPITKTLRIYTEITVKVTKTDYPAPNEFYRTKTPNKISYEFDQIYNEHFLNYNQIKAKYTPLEEEGKMLIICYDDFMDEMQDFVTWKNTIGRPTEMVGISTVGTSASDIKSYVENYYNTNGLTYLLLVGDAAQVPAMSGGDLGGDSDNAYGYISGDDHYQELFVGRFSATTGEQVTTMVTRAIAYENGATLGNGWLNQVVGVASDQGPGDDDEYDYQHYRNMATDLLGYTYTTSHELFDGDQDGNDADGNPSPTDVANVINAGVSLALYTGHGGDTEWATSGFSVSDVNNLTNTGKWIYSYTVACVVGNFVANGECFAESWLRASDGSGNPTGAVGFYGSTINQSWAPPMVGQDEMVDILVESYSNNIKRTFAGIGVNGMFLMNDETSDYDMTDTWTCFGDPSFMVRTDDPANMTITHDDAIIFGASDFQVSCDFDGALATISKDGEIIGSAYVSNGNATIPLNDQIAPGDVVKLAVVGYNKITYLTDINVIAPAGAYISMTDFDIDGAQSMDYNSTKNLNFTLTNLGPDQANGVTATITTDDQYITLSNNENISIGDIAGDNGTATNSSVVIHSATNVPDQYSAQLHITITDENDSTWQKDFTITINAPDLVGEFGNINDTDGQLAFASSPLTTIGNNSEYTYNVEVKQIGGNNNGLLDAGENVILTFNAENIGHAGIYNAYGHLTTTSEYITINNAETYIDTLNVGETFANEFNISVDSAAPTGTMAEFTFIFGTPQYKDTLVYNLPIGLIIESFETGDFSAYNWQQGGDANWTVVADSPQDGSYCAKSGDINDEQTSEISLQLNGVPAGQTMSFYYKVSSESGYDFLKFYVNGTEIASWSDEVPWTEYTYTFTDAGNYTIKFAYEKDYSDSAGSDCGWIDYLILPVAPVKAKSAKAITITAPTLPSWTTLTDNGDGTAVLTGTAPATNEDDPVVLEATDGTNTISQEFTIRVGVTEIATDNNIVKFFPNPTTNFLNIQLLNKEENAELTIMDLSGKTLLIKQLTQQSSRIDLTGFAKGTYLLKLNLNGKILQNKIIIQ